MQPQKSRCVSQVMVHSLLFCGFCLVIFAAVLPVFWPYYYQTLVSNELKMTPTSKTYEAWKESPVPIYIEFFFFNWTNRESLEEDGDTHIPQLQELGPYRFNERIERVNVTWNDNNTVTYEQARFWHFDPDNSKGSLDDQITTLNVIALTAAFTVREWSLIFRASTSSALGVTKQKIHVVRSVRELLFDGYSDALITMARSMPSFSGVTVPLDKFGWFYQRNGTTFMDGVFNMNTGVEDVGDLGKLEFWNYKKHTDYFDGDCAKVEGTTGQLFPPGQTREGKVQMFSPDLCRSIAFEFGEDTVVENVPGYKYVGGLSMLDNGTLYPDNLCFCNGECVPSGVVNVTSCRFGAPAFASFPHFYLADPFFGESVRGLHPVQEKHQFYLTLEPTTGIPLDVAARFQINLLLQPLPSMSLYENVPTLFFPMMWFQQRATVTPQLAFSLRALLLLRHLGLGMAVVAAVTGCSLIAYSLILRCKANQRTMQLVKDKEDGDTYEYVAASDLPKSNSLMEKNQSNQYIVMKPRSEKKPSVKT